MTKFVILYFKFCVSWTSKRLMITSGGTFYSRRSKEWVLGQNGLGGCIGASPQLRSLSWLTGHLLGSSGAPED